jgi:hypothetical protein
VGRDNSRVGNSRVGNSRVGNSRVGISRGELQTMCVAKHFHQILFQFQFNHLDLYGRGKTTERCSLAIFSQKQYQSFSGHLPYTVPPERLISEKNTNGLTDSCWEYEHPLTA